MPRDDGPGRQRRAGAADLAALGIPSEHEYIRRYCERTGRVTPDELLADWDFYLAYNLFRLAAITQGIARRALDGTAASAQAQATGAVTRKLAELAWRFVRKP